MFAPERDKNSCRVIWELYLKVTLGPDHARSNFGLPGATGLKNALRTSFSDIPGMSYSCSSSAFVGW